MKKQNIFVFDVEATRLHGIGFAVGAVVLNQFGLEIDRFELMSEESSLNADNWVLENVMPHLTDLPKCDTDRELRDAFYAFYMKHKENADIWSDCCYPVETNFLNKVLNDDYMAREWDMPYPLKDISTLVDNEIDRAKECGVFGLRKHHPTDDSIASAMLLIKALNQK